jgi:iron complex transport system ATP-binding protein
MSGGGAILRAVNLHCGHGCVEVLGSANLEAREGEVLVLIGPNGTGKTTLLHTLGRLLPAQRSEVRLGGRPLRGMRSREVARMLAQAPRVLLLDEPATYLDLQHQAELLALVRSLARDDGLAVVLTMHDLSLAALCADRVALLAPGGLRVTGTPAEVLREEILRPVYGERLEVFAHPARGSPVVPPLAAR